MAGSVLTSILLLLATPIIHCGVHANEPPFPKLIDWITPNGLAQIHVVYEISELNGGYRTIEEFVDRDVRMEAYIEMRNNVRTTWLHDMKAKTIYRYSPFSCRMDDYVKWSPFHQMPTTPKIPADGTDTMYSIHVLHDFFNLSSPKQYSRTASRKNGGLQGLETFGHKWSLATNGIAMSMLFSESKKAGQSKELLLDSIEIKAGSKKTTIKILSIERELPQEAYNNQLQLPLIYGCRRNATILSEEMQQKFDIIAADLTTRQHITARARGTKFRANNSTTSEENIIELALSQPRDANSILSPVRTRMTSQQNSQGHIKTLVDRYLNVKYEVNKVTGNCTISGGDRSVPNNGDKSSPVVLQFSDRLTLSITTEVLESMLYTVSKESFMKLEQRGDSTQYAYFADTGSIGRVVRRYSFGATGRSKLDSFAIWIFESATKVREVYDFEIIESKSLDSDANSAQTFDMSRECYIDNGEALEGRDYAWFEINYSLPAEQVDALRDKVEDLKNTFYRLIRADLNLNYLRIPKMEAIFSGEPSGFAIKMLVLDSLPLHLIYDEFKYSSLESSIVVASQIVGSLYDCSQFCWENQCTGMTFSRDDGNCSLTMSLATLQDYLKEDENDSSDSYLIPKGREFWLFPRLQQQIEPLHSSRPDVSKILGFSELNQVHPIGNLQGFNNLRTKIELNGREVILAPVSVRVGSEPERVNDLEPEKMIFDETDSEA